MAENIPNFLLFNKRSGKIEKKEKEVKGSGLNGTLDYKDIEILKSFISERGRIMPRRLTGVSAMKQREIKRAVKRARNAALLPFTAK